MFLHTRAPAAGDRVRRGAALALALGTVLGGCSRDRQAVTTPKTASPVAQADRPGVVATTSVICDLTQQIAETTVALTCLLDPGIDPHTYQVKPSDRQALDQADLILYDGYGYAPTMIALVEASTTDAPRVPVYEKAVPNPLMGEAHDHDHGAEAAHEHGGELVDGSEAEPDHNHDQDSDAMADADSRSVREPTRNEYPYGNRVPDPHVWHSATNNAAMVAVIADSLAQINPDQGDRYAKNADRLATQFTAIDRWIKTQVATVPAAQRQLVTTHDSFGYFAEAYGFEVKGALSGLTTDAKPTPSALTALVNQVKAAQVPAIFAETTTNPQLIQTVAKDAGVRVADQPLFVEGPGGPGTAAETTQAMLVVNTCVVVEALGGSCDRGSAPL